MAEVLLFFVVLKAVQKAYYAVPLSRREFDALHWPYSIQLLSVAAALALIALFDRRRRRYGLVPNWAADLRLGGGLALLFIVVPMLTMTLFGGLVPKTKGPGYVVSTLLFQFFLSGIGEEIVYRGYIQSRLNAAFGRPVEIGGVRFGAGLFITAALFGLAHALSGFNPFVSSFRINLFYGLVTGVWGLVYGLLRERTGSIVGAGILHGHEAIIENVVVTAPGQLAYVACLLITFVALLRPSRVQQRPPAILGSES
jgi:hypothetical protein